LTGSVALEFGHDGVVNVERRLHMAICIIRMAIWQSFRLFRRIGLVFFALLSLGIGSSLF
jgi:hypothetical protein